MMPSNFIGLALCMIVTAWVVNQGSTSEKSNPNIISTWKNEYINRQIDRAINSYVPLKCNNGGAPSEDILKAELQIARRNSKWINLGDKKTNFDEMLLMHSKLKPPPGVKSSCSTFECRLKEYYSENNSIRRILTELVFLKYGYLVNPNSKKRELDNPDWQSGVYSVEELNGIYLVLEELPISFHNMAFLKEIHKLPNGMDIVAEKDKVTGVATKYTCGEADAGAKTIWIDYTCANRTELKYGVKTYTHELGHQWNYARSPSLWNTIDESSEWTGLSGWAKTKFIDPVTMDFKIVWSHDNVAGFVSDYATLSPIEDFAESVAHFYTDPQKMFTKSEVKYKFIQDKVFSGLSYTVADREEALTKKIQLKIWDVLLVAFEGCFGANESAPNSIDKVFNYSDIPLSQKEISCIENSFLSSFNAAISNAQGNTYNGCVSINSESIKVVYQSVVSSIQSHLKSLLSSSRSLKDRNEAIREFSQRYSERFDIDEEFLKCFDGTSGSQNCYIKYLNQSFAVIAQPLEDKLGPFYNEEKDRFLEKSSFKNKRDELKNVFLNKLGAVASDTRIAEDLHKQCWGSQLTFTQDIEMVLRFPYYIDSNYLNCLNSKIKKVTIDYATNYNGQVLPGNYEKFAWYSLADEVKKVTTDYVAKVRDMEQKNVESILGSFSEALFINLTGDGKNIILGAAPFNQCLDHSTDQYKVELESRKLELIFENSNLVAEQYAIKICQKISKHPDFRAAFEANKIRKTNIFKEKYIEILRQKVSAQEQICKMQASNAEGFFSFLKGETACVLLESLSIAKQSYMDLKKTELYQNAYPNGEGDGALKDWVLDNASSLIKEIMN